MAERETPELESHELSRYAKHLSLPEVGKEGQLRLKASRVVVVGAGGLGSALALYLENWVPVLTPFAEFVETYYFSWFPLLKWT